jgi:ribonuclease Z
MGFELKILGANSAIPTATRNTTSQLISINQSHYLIDCGEGTQIQMRKYRVKMQRIKTIFISHLHGDHFFGLIGLLNTMHLLGRQNELLIFCPPGLREIINLQLKVADSRLNFEIKFEELEFNNGQNHIYTDNIADVYTIPLDHRIPCNGFLFVEKPKNRRIKKELIDKLKIPIEQLPKIKEGADFHREDGRVFQNEEITLPPRKSYSYAFCSDTRYNDRIVPFIENVDLLYHEATFTEAFRERAQQTYHSTALDAATIAEKAKVGKLIIGHYSARYKNFDQHLEEAREVFANTELALDGHTFSSRDL